MENTYAFFSRLIGTLSVILLVSAYIGSTQYLKKYIGKKKDWKLILIIGLFGGIFGIYGNISGIDLNGAVISVRDIGPMLSGFFGGPLSGILSGVIAGAHRLTMGGNTAVACVVATTLIGLICGCISKTTHNILKRPVIAFLIGMAMEAMHLCIVLIMVKPFSEAFDIVRQIAIPFISVNAVGIALMAGIINYIEKQQEIAVERERLKSELEVANVIQHSLLPYITDTYPGRSEIEVSASMEAAKEVGGDFYDVFFVSNDRIAFLIGDVSGKGVPAALFMASAKLTLQNCIRDDQDLSKALFSANNTFCKNNEADMFVTLWAGILDLEEGILTYSSAGHNPPVLIRGGKAEFFKTKSNFILAGMENITYKEAELRLEDGDMIFMYTDGVTEATTAANELYGNDRLLACLNNSAGADPHSVLANVKKSISEFVRDNEQFDDMTMLCFKWK